MFQFGAIIADIVLICIFIFSITTAIRKGFTLLVFNCVCAIITIIAVLVLCKPITNYVYENTNWDESISESIENSIGEFINDQIEKNGKINTGKTNISQPIADQINNYINDAKENAVDDIAKYVADQLSYIVISAIVVIVLSIVIRIATIFLRSILHFITELPIIHSLDKIGGFGYGVLRAYIIVYLILAILSLLSPLISNTGIIASINHSNLCEKFYNDNVLLNIFIQK